MAVALDANDSGQEYHRALEKAKMIQGFRIDEVHAGVLKAISNSFK